MNAQLAWPAATASRPSASAIWAGTRLNIMLGGLPLQRRLPPIDDPTRWRKLRLHDRELQFAQPLTFTPYASAQPCSARCRFCSETLRPRQAGPLAATLRPDADYFTGLRAALQALGDLPMAWSLSGLEASDDSDWLLRLLHELSAAEAAGSVIEQRVLYSNGNGFAGAAAEQLIDALGGFGLSWLEWSRHAHDEVANQALMRFRDGIAIRHNRAFAQALARVQARMPVKLVCVVQRGGVDTLERLCDYVDWAASLGADAVIFRELARLDAGYRDNLTARYLDSARIGVADLLADALHDVGFARRVEPLHRTQGYYFSNVVLRERSGLELVFEAADYAAMHERHASGRVYKLVYFSNGELCGGWQPGQDVLWRAHD